MYMVKSQLIKDITTNQISLEEGLQRLLIITDSLENKPLKDWILNELNGYGDVESLPDYRKNIGCITKYSGLNGQFQITNHPLPSTFLPKDLRDLVKTAHARESIKTVERIIENNETVGSDLTDLAAIIYKETGVQCYMITKKHSLISYEGIRSNIKNKLITILLDLEKNFGVLDSMDIDTQSITKEKAEELNRQLNNIFYDGKSEVINND